MRSLAVRLTAICIGALVSTGHVAAQRVNAISIAGGITPIVKSVGSFPYKTGVNAQLSMDLVRVFGRLGVRADIFIHSFERDTRGTSLSRRTLIPGASASLVLPLTQDGARLQPYLLAAAGTFRTDLGQGGPESHFGLGAGGGLEVHHGPVRPFIEVRRLAIFDGGTPRTVPMVLGLRF